MKKRLIIDGQIFQTEARDRGMGRYSAHLVNAIVETATYEKVEIIMASSGHTNPLGSDMVARLFPGVEVTYLPLVNAQRLSVEVAREKNRTILSAYVDETHTHGQEIEFLVPSPFQEPVVSVYPQGVKRSVVFYDLIPYLYHTRYEPLMPFANYLKRFDLLFAADTILAISQSVRDDLVTYLGLKEDKIAVIDGAAIRSDKEPVKPENVDIPRRYILMPTSDDPRKNNLRAVIGFEEFRAQQQEDYKLVITSKIHPNERRRLELFSKNIIFTGNLPSEMLDWLYLHADAILFVPESEGLGLPILEAVHANKRVICSELNVFKEISSDAFYFCDHENQHDIAAGLIRAFNDSPESIDKAEYASILKRYSWQETGKRSVKALERVQREQLGSKPKIAVFIPRPDGLSAVGKVVAEGHAALSEVFDVYYYYEKGSYGGSTRPNFLQYVAHYASADSFGVEKYAEYSAVFYHVGNSDYHISSIAHQLYLPGYTILHDTNIGEAYRIMLEKGMISQDRYDAEVNVNQLLAVDDSSYLGSVLAAQRGMLAHSQYALKASEKVLTRKCPAIFAALPTHVPSMPRKRRYENITVGLAGILAGIKGVKVIESLVGRHEYSDVKFKLFGYDFTGDDSLEKLSAHQNVTVSTNLTDFDFQYNLSRLDIFVNYRMKYQGETSLSTLEAMRHGVVVIVRNIGWYAELPDNVVVKVDDEADVESALTALKSDPERLRQVAESARQYVATHHTHAKYAQAMLDIVGKDNDTNTYVEQASGALKNKSIKTKGDLLALYHEGAA